MDDRYEDDFTRHLAEELKDPEFRKYWEEDEAEFQLRLAIIDARNETGMTQEQLARASGLDQRVISRIQTGNANPTLRTIGKLAKGFGKKLEIRFV
ncbi:transcriptional regulator [Gordonibacter sp. 28C]|uniref:helix-turn-helix transcriptional regulator n=1 Tax=Gordonibacter sp. 28C TaxID=2078569 RepID=UPI000DF7DF68|nr:helix-turn-helix transcriptional regulator [Gordonibacter sp. 28C]RDB61610.1 transcriptional regulator [Gordonibacter sp. 28C]